jgi:hypothetical protein
VKELVQKYRLEPIPRDSLVTDDPIPVGLPPEELTRRGPWPRPYPGGLRFPHLHLRGEVFRLEPAQWQEFSRGIITKFQEKLGRAKSVSFEQLLEFSEATAGLV